MTRTRQSRPKSDRVFVGFRFPAALVQAIDAHAERMRARDRFASVNRSDAARELIALGLDVVEGKKEKKHGR